jgi:hypothetical protein
MLAPAGTTSLAQRQASLQLGCSLSWTVFGQYRGEGNVSGGKTWEATVLDDFAEFRKAGLEHPLMGEIAAMFAEASATPQNAPVQV